MGAALETGRSGLLIVADVDGCAVTLGQHAIDRYWERVRPTLPTARHAADDLQQIAEAYGEIRDAPPAWKDDVYAATRHERRAVAWLWLGDDVALPLTACLYDAGAFFVPTCLTRGGCSDELRERRAALRRNERRQSAQRRAAIRGSGIYRRQTAGHRAPRLRPNDLLEAA